MEQSYNFITKAPSFNITQRIVFLHLFKYSKFIFHKKDTSQQSLRIFILFEKLADILFWTNHIFKTENFGHMVSLFLRNQILSFIF